MTITDRLNVEHGVFLRQLTYLDSLLRREAPTATIEAVLRTIAGAVTSHCRVEDRFLLPAIEQAFGEAPVLSAIRAEHAEIDEMLSLAFADTVDATFARAFSSRLRTHIETEIHFLIPLAEEWLTPERLAATNWNVDHVCDHARSEER